MKKVLVLLGFFMFTLVPAVNAGECGSGSWTPQYVRMGSSKVYHVDGNGGFTPVNNWNDVTATYGHNVQWAQGQTCGCTLRQPGSNYHVNPICRNAYSKGLQ